MRNVRASVVLGALVTAVLVATWARAPRAQTAGSADVVKVAEAYVKASLAGDVKSIVALYTDDAIEMPPFQPMIKGKAAIEQYDTKEMAAPTKLKSFALTHIESKTSGDIGYDVGTYTQTVSDGKESMNDAGKYTVIVKRVGGDWKVAYAIYNSDSRPPAMQGQ